MISEVLFKLKKVYDWDKFVKSMQIVYNIGQQNNIKMILYFLIYDRTTRLPIEKELLKLNILLNKVVILIHRLSLFRESARIIIKKV